MYIKGMACKSVRLTVIVVAWHLDILTSRNITNLLLGIFIFEQNFIFYSYYEWK